MNVGTVSRTQEGDEVIASGQRPDRRGIRDAVAATTPDRPLAMSHHLPFHHYQRSVIAYAHAHTGCIASLDDLQARLFAEGFGLKVIGTIGVLIKAKQLQVIPSIREQLHNLQHQGFHLSTEVQNEALRLAGEE
ncbi:nucleic acid-binding protein, PIN domain [Candidatus Vecturithrix granuli]|uniref:Nucleic acid-binding protein, PIN domain n=1 Tax=Vecturithrix granuli TaxID=1499967 RepID=A0A081C8Y6_VECG1|nr:nucleic acid-binding protein, PIN domain [Candidatus Vecturithrix granuli]